jgi:ATP:ADP antiporter, AAA family
MTLTGPGDERPPAGEGSGERAPHAVGGAVRMLRLLPGELPLVLLFGTLMFANSLAMQISYVSSVSGFLKSGGVNGIWIVWLVNAAVFLAIASAQSVVIDRFRRVPLMRAVLAGFAITFVLLWTLLQVDAPNWLVFGALYVVAEQQWLLFPVLYWVLANDAMGVAQAKRVFPLLAGWGLMGKLLGLAVAASAPLLLQTWGLDLGHLLLLNGAVYLGAMGILGALSRRARFRSVTRKPEAPRRAFAEGFEFIRDVPAFKYLTVALLALMVCDTIIEFRFLVLTDAAFLTTESYQTFYGLYRMVAVALALLLQVFVTNRLLARMELKQVLSFQPYVAVTVLIALLALPGLVSAIGALLLFRLVAETFQHSARVSFQGLVPEERRGRVSLVMESFVIASGTAAGALLIGAAVSLASATATFDPALVYLPVALAAAVFAAVACWRMYGSYDASLLNWRLKRRQRAASSVLDKLL